MRTDIIKSIPEHWLINTSPTINWYLKEGIWVHKQHEAILRIIAVYLQLKEIPEALAELEECRQTFLTRFAPKLLKWVNVQKSLALAKGTLKAVQLNTAPVTKEDTLLIAKIFSPWVDRWAVGSKPMLNWVVAESTLEAIRQPLGLNREQLRKANGKPAANLVNFAMQFDPELAWAWKLILSGDYNRMEATKRELARRSVQAMGYHRMQERVFLIHARYWIMVYILGYLEADLLELINRTELKGTGGATLEDFSTKILGPINKALEYRHPKGRPQGKRRQREEILRQIDAMLGHTGL